MPRPRRFLLPMLAACVVALTGVCASAFGGTLDKPIDPQQFSNLPYSARSFWLQPWRSFMDTWPAARFRNAVGINFNVSPNDAAATARALAASGFKEARVEIPWNQIDFDDPSHFNAQALAGNALKLKALHDNGIRPLILLNSNDAEPTPTEQIPVTLQSAAAAGATSVQLAPKSVSDVVPGRSGFDDDNFAAGVLITSVSQSGLAKLSRPLPDPLAAGTQKLRVLLYEPFAAPTLANGSPNPRFEKTLAGWLKYVNVTTSYVKSIYGSDDFDVEIWNELGFGSRFLFNNAYYTVPPDAKATGSAQDALLQRTVSYLRDPANGVSDIGIGNGFVNQTHLYSGSDMPVGVTALDQHPYNNGGLYPQDLKYSGQKPINGLGVPDFTTLAGSILQDTFVPSFRDFFPEHWLTGIQTETLIRDLSPTLTPGFKLTLHGRDAAPDGGTPPQMWITEYNLDTGAANAWTDPPLDTNERNEMLAKAALRTYSAWIGKGVTQIDMFAATGIPTLSMIPQSFFDALHTGTANPDPGPTLTAVGRLAAFMAGPDTITPARSLTLDKVSDTHDNAQFAGGGLAGAPPLFDRDVLGFFPFQADANRFEIPIYVMTRDMSHNYLPGAPTGTPGRFDLPPETFAITVGGVDGSKATANYFDPLTGGFEPVQITDRTATTVTLSLAATDYPRILTLADGVDLPPDAPSAITDPGALPGADASGLTVGPPAGLRLKAASRRHALKHGLRVAVTCPAQCGALLAVGPKGSTTPVIASKTVRSVGARKIPLRLTSDGRRYVRTHPRKKLVVYALTAYNATTFGIAAAPFRLR